MHFLQIMGNLGADPETRMTTSGQKVTSLRVACKSRKGAQEETLWWRVTIWGDRFDKMMPYLKKGSSVIVNGDMQAPTIYQDREGANRVSLEMTANAVNFSPFGKKDDSENASSNAGQSSASFGAPTGGFRQPAPASYAAPAPMYGSSHAAPSMAAAPAYASASFSEGLEGAANPTDDDLPF